LILIGEASLRKALTQFQQHYHEERNHQGKGNVLLFPAPARLEPVGAVASAVENASAAYSGTTAVPHEYFDQMSSCDTRRKLHLRQIDPTHPHLPHSTPLKLDKQKRVDKVSWSILDLLACS
jgi:hypothetical protein